MIYSPVKMFFMFFLFPALLSSLGLISNIRPLKVETLIIIFISFFIFYFGSLLGRLKVGRRRNKNKKKMFYPYLVSARCYQFLVVSIWSFSSYMVYYYYSTLGGLPIFLTDIDNARSSVGGAGQFISMLIKPFMTVGFILLFAGEKVIVKSHKGLR
ncbi:hypothetical protein N8217_03805, partial [Glaciecola sp.]|nr:hypothetical protein [Glaciecola sp.]